MFLTFSKYGHFRSSTFRSFSKDIDTIDNTLNDALRMALSTFASVLGSIILIGIIEHYFLIAVGPSHIPGWMARRRLTFVTLKVFFIIGLYYMAAQFYRQSARELKRLGKLVFCNSTQDIVANSPGKFRQPSSIVSIRTFRGITFRLGDSSCLWRKRKCENVALTRDTREGSVLTVWLFSLTVLEEKCGLHRHRESRLPFDCHQSAMARLPSRLLRVFVDIHCRHNRCRRTQLSLAVRNRFDSELYFDYTAGLFMDGT